MTPCLLTVSPHPVAVPRLADEGVRLAAGDVIPVVVVVIIVVVRPDCQTVLAFIAIWLSRLLVPVLIPPSCSHILPAPDLPSKAPLVICTKSDDSIRKVEIVSHPVPDRYIWDCGKHTTKLCTVFTSLISKTRLTYDLNSC